MGYPLPDNGTYRLHLPPSPSPFASSQRANLQGLFVQIQREATAHPQCTQLLTRFDLEKESLWIRFKSSKAYLIRIYVNGVNAISERTSPGANEQDYIVTPDQYMLYGHKTSYGPMATRDQFDCPQFADSSSDMESHYGIQFEITPDKSRDHFTASLDPLYTPSSPLYLYLNSAMAEKEFLTMVRHR
jgi:hypothetical protein